MNESSQNDRIINGLLKADIGLLSPEQIQQRLSQSVLINVDPLRATVEDLWPCVWFLAAILEREFYEYIYIRAGLSKGLPSPVSLGPRCVFVADDFEYDGLSIGVGISTTGDIWGDARGQTIGYKRVVAGSTLATPVSGCALAGYLGFAALAYAGGIPPFHQRWSGNSLDLPSLDAMPTTLPPLAVLGNGQIGQAFLALGFFLAKTQPIRLHLVDKDEFEGDNYRSQLLLSEDCGNWVDLAKVEVLATTCNDWGWETTGVKEVIRGDWQNPLGHDTIAFLGFDNMEARRICAQGSFAWIVECGVGTDFLKPHISWHSLPPEKELAQRFFADLEDRHEEVREQTEFLTALDNTPGACGRLRFESVDAAAPCMGAVAVAFAWCELLRFLAGEKAVIEGGAYLWSPLQPYQRDRL